MLGWIVIESEELILIFRQAFTCLWVLCFIERNEAILASYQGYWQFCVPSNVAERIQETPLLKQPKIREPRQTF